MALLEIKEFFRCVYAQYKITDFKLGENLFSLSFLPMFWEKLHDIEFFPKKTANSYLKHVRKNEGSKLEKYKNVTNMGSESSPYAGQ